MAKTQFNVEQLKAEAVKPLYAVAGATEIAYEFARDYTAEAQKQAQERLTGVQSRVSKIERDPKALQGQAVSLVNARIDELQKDAKDAQAKFEARVAELQKDAKAASKAPGNKSKPAAKKATAQGGAKGGATTAKKTAAKKTTATQASAATSASA